MTAKKMMFSRALVSYAGWQSYRDLWRHVNITVDNGYSGISSCHPDRYDYAMRFIFPRNVISSLVFFET